MRDDNKRPDGTTLLPWARGKPMAWDVTVPDTYADSSHIRSTATKPGAAALKTAQNKYGQYSLLLPICVETAGTWYDMAIELTQEIRRCITTITENTGETTFILWRLPIALQMGMPSPSISLWSPYESAVATISHLLSFNFHACGFVLVGKKY